MSTVATIRRGRAAVLRDPTGLNKPVAGFETATVSFRVRPVPGGGCQSPHDCFCFHADADRGHRFGEPNAISRRGGANR